MSFLTSYNSASIRGWQKYAITYSLLTNSTSNGVNASDLVITSNANTAITIASVGGGNNKTTATKNTDNTVSIANTILSPLAGAIRITSTGTEVRADGGINANSLVNNGYVTGPIGTYYGTVTNQWLGSGIATSQDANVIVATQGFPSNGVSQIRVWRDSGNGYVQSNVTVNANYVLYSPQPRVALNSAGNVLLLCQSATGKAGIFEYDAGNGIWNETANLSVTANASGDYGSYPYLNAEGNIAIINSVGYNNGATIWKKNGNAWASSTANLFTTANSTNFFNGQKVVYGDNGNILGTCNIIDNKYYFAIYTNYTGNYELLQLLENPYSNSANTGYGQFAEMSSDGRWLVTTASATANSLATNRFVFYYK